MALHCSFISHHSLIANSDLHRGKRKKKEKQEKQGSHDESVLQCPLTLLIFFSDPLLCLAKDPYIGSISPGFGGSPKNYINNDGILLESINKDFGFGFVTTPASVTLFTLSVVHRSSSKLIWSANRASPVANSDNLQFQDNGTVVLRSEERGSDVWRLDNSGKNASRIELRDSGNLVVVSGDGTSIWESFDHPTDTLITSQVFKEGMKLTSNASSWSNMTYTLEIKSGDMVLSVNSLTPQVYWSMRSENGRIIEKDGGVVTSSSILGNSWRFFGEKQALLWRFLITDNIDDNGTWIAVLGSNGVISFTSLGSGVSAADSSIKIPNDQCATPETCDPYYVCTGSKVCGCLSGLSSVRPNCKTGTDTSPCKKTENNAALSVKLVNAGERVDYSALEFASPFSKNTILDNCKDFCSNNCSCLGLFFQNSSGNCFLFDWIGSFKTSGRDGSGFVSYIKVATNDLGGESNGDGNGKHFPYIVIVIVLPAVFIIGVLIFVAFWIRRRTKSRLLASQETTTHSFVNILPCTSIQFSYKDLQLATRNFTEKLGQGGFGSVFKGTLPDGSHIAVKQLEGIGQGKKEFKAEVSTIGSIHHQNSVHLTGFCEEGTHRLLVYEYLAKGSLERWIFRRRDGDGDGDILLLDWDTRFKIAVGTAKGLAYLQEDCEARIIHCDIKPQNILLDDDFNAKVSDFGLAKLMTREQSHVFTTLRGTRGYMAPEWITTYAISEKSDVYSYRMVLVEIIRRRKNQESPLASSNFPAYAFERMREGLLIEDVDWDMEEEEEGVDVMNDERVQRAMKTAFWCIQEDMHLRPSMNKVVQMLEGVFPVLQPPSSYTLDVNRYTRLKMRLISEEGGGRTSSPVSHSELSGPR
ncbi:G-type lectin S-receptor-like serine/threonine-protein kinase SD2-5 [Raphanus sativus]|uniref:Receptor-like serine/threonine-protein kinase n=1 Tax=Raphanus sativus TaxID=3726 RepID=A0A9W3D916_RAPSA|nr:G-type lectin S-receptor-like serine/threonine-protein kinase SD2-5 [Raphanus sativus]